MISPKKHLKLITIVTIHSMSSAQIYIYIFNTFDQENFIILLPNSEMRLIIIGLQKLIVFLLIVYVVLNTDTSV